jgi:predicted TIM-barrel fold metal-dependent hydrolase
MVVNVVQETSRSGEQQSEVRLRRVDCDVHPIFANAWTDELSPYMSREWGMRLLGGGSITKSDGVERNLASFQLQLPRSMYPARLPSLREDLMQDGVVPCTNSADSAAYLLDGCEIDRAVLQPQGSLSLGDIPNPDASAILASATNDWLAEKWLSQDPRWRGTIVVSVHEPVRAAAEIRRCAPNKRFVGVQMPLSNTLLGHPNFSPVYEAAQEFGLPIVLHPNNASGQYAMSAPFAGGVPHYLLELKANVSSIYSAQVASLVANGMFQRFPKLKAIFTEVGYAWVPDLMWKMDAFWRTARDDTPWLDRSPSEIITQHCRFTTQPFVEPSKHKYIAQILEMFNADRTLMFATDYPHWNSEEPWAVEKLIPEEYRHRVLVDNAVETFGDRLL